MKKPKEIIMYIFFEEKTHELKSLYIESLLRKSNISLEYCNIDWARKCFSNVENVENYINEVI